MSSFYCQKMSQPYIPKRKKGRLLKRASLFEIEFVGEALHLSGCDYSR